MSIILALVAAISWGANAHIIRKGMQGENQFLGIVYRSLFASPILIIISFLLGDKLAVYFQKDVINYVLLSSLFVTFGDAIFMYALKNYPVYIMQPIASVYPLFTTGLLIITGIEDIGIFILVGTILVITGVAIVTSKHENEIKFDSKAIILGVSSAFFWGSSVYMVRIILAHDGTNSFGVTGIRTLIMGFTALLLYLTTRSSEEKNKPLSKKFFLYLTISGIVGWVIGASMFFIAVQSIGAAIPTPISSTNPVFAAIFGYYLGIEIISKKQFMGILITVAGIILIVI